VRSAELLWIFSIAKIFLHSVFLIPHSVFLKFNPLAPCSSFCKVRTIFLCKLVYVALYNNSTLITKTVFAWSCRTGLNIFRYFFCRASFRLFDYFASVWRGALRGRGRILLAGAVTFRRHPCGEGRRPGLARRGAFPKRGRGG
jgi:hypothetical protein